MFESRCGVRCNQCERKEAKTGKTIYERLGLEAPAHWDDNAVKITADKYLFGSEPGSLESREAQDDRPMVSSA